MSVADIITKATAFVDAAFVDAACFCVGPQNGAPLCPCQMRYVTIRAGRYVRETDLGPVPVNQPGLKPITSKEIL